MAGITGSFQGLERLGKKFANVASAKFRRGLTSALAKESLRLIEQGFRNETDPYGHKWRALKRKRKGKGILDRTGKMRKSFRAVGTGEGVQITNSTDYASHHQFGAPKAKVPRRQMVPMTETGALGRLWGKAYKKVAGDFLRKWLKR